MGTFSAKHFLDIYQTRLEMIQGKITHPEEETVEFVKLFISELEQLDPKTKIKMINSKKETTFIEKKTSKVLAILKH